MKRILTAAIVFALAGIVPATATATPLADELVAGGTHWVAWRLVVPDHMIVAYEVEIAGDESARQAAVAEWLVGDNGITFTVVSLSNPGNGGTHVQTIATGTLIDQPGDPMTVEHGIGVVHRLPPGTYTLVLAWDGAGSGVGRLFGDPGLQIVGRTDGAEASWSPQREFDGVANADMDGTGATLAGSVGRDIAHALFGAFLKFPGRGVEVMSYTGPSAGIAADEAAFVDTRGPTAGALSLPFFIFNGTAAGRYDFSVLAGVHQEGGVTLMTADVRLP